VIEGKAGGVARRHLPGAIPAFHANMESGRNPKEQVTMRRIAARPLLFAGALLAAGLAAPSAQAEWRGRGHGWGHGHHRHWAPPPPRIHHHHHHRGWNGAPLLGAIIGLGAGVAIGSALAAPPPPPVYYAPPPPPVYYQPPAVVYQPPPVIYQPGGVYAPAKSAAW
jgi:hypothetical protein